ncbi:GNAT family N-acetyltransferase [Riemerella columbina]|uniref:GNAT family N-acetyltransferase n=1 Tax=Riemerella columbina TaxID=103810 RepID=UPI0003700A68|nr:GNAT family N-acetyltransferase [Riemerella columbina]
MTTFYQLDSKAIPLIQELASKSWRSNYAEILSLEQIQYMLDTMYSTETLKEHFIHPKYHYYGINYLNDNVGFIGYETDIESSTTKLHRLYLLKEFKGKGIGKEVMDFLKHQVVASGNHRVILNVNKQNPAIQFYEKQGFKIYDEGVFDIGQNFVMDDYLMECLLG